MSRTAAPLSPRADEPAAAAAGGEAFAPWPRPLANTAACFEFAAPWIALLFAGFALVLALLMAMQAQQAQALRDARLHITLHEISDRLEADLALGYELQDNARAQSLLEDALAHDARLLSAEVFDARGVSLFNTDRGSIGEQVPEGWLESARARLASRHANQPWAVTLGGDRTLGVALLGPFGEVTGHTSITARLVPARAPVALLGSALAMAALLVLLAWIAARRALRAALDEASDDAMNAAVQRLAASQARLDRTLQKLTSEEGAGA